MTQAPQGKSKVVAGVLNIIISGVGNMYLGYIGKGIAQFILGMCVVGWIWSVIDAISILQGKTKDAKGNPLV